MAGRQAARQAGKIGGLVGGTMQEFVRFAVVKPRWVSFLHYLVIIVIIIIISTDK